MKELLIKMADGGMITYNDDFMSYRGCPTCDYGSSYITEIDIELTKYKIHIKTNRMFDYVISEGQMMKFFLTKYNEILNKTEKEFIEWFKEEVYKIAGDNKAIEEFKVIKIEEEK